MNKPIVSAIMPTYNRKEYLREAIESILNQTFKDFELIIVDDGSTDGSLELIKNFQKKDSRIILIQNDNPGGISRATNEGIKKSRGKYIAKMDSDDVSLPNRFKKQVNFLEKHPDIGACGSWVKTIGENEGNTWQLPTDHDSIKCTMLFCGAIANPTNMIRRSVFFDLGYWYDETCFAAEDYEFWTRIVNKVKLANIPEVLLLYRLHPTNTFSSDNTKHFESTKNTRLRQIKTLGLKPTEDEMGIHIKMGNSEFIGGRKAIDKIEGWAKKLVEANKRTGIYPGPVLSKIVEQKKGEAIKIHRKYRENFKIMVVIIGLVAFTGKVLRKFLPGHTVDKIYKILVKTYQFGQRKKEYFLSKTERYRIMLGFGTKLQREVPKKFKIGMAVLAHERPEYLKLCLDSLFRTKLHDYDITFLIHDDGSKDPKVKEIINTPRDKKYEILRVFNPKGHNSWAGAFNRAMKKLLETGDFDIVGSCDSDALFHPEWLDKTMRIALWAKKNHKNHVLGPFSSFNSSDYEFHNILGTYKSPFGNYLVKERMGALTYFYFKEDFLKLGYYPENKDDETLMTEKFKKLRVRYFCTETSYADHIGEESVLNQWRPTAVKKAVYGMHLAKEDWGADMEKLRPFGYYRYLKDANQFGKSMRTPSKLKLDVVIPAIKKDLDILPLTIKSIRKNLRHPLEKIYIVGPKDTAIIRFCKQYQCNFRNEDTVLPIVISDVKKIGYIVGPWDRTGWIFQQLLKLNCDAISSQNNIYVLDADTILVSPQKFEINGKSILLVSDEYHPPYFETFKKVMGFKASAPFSFVSHQMLFNAKRLKELRQTIEKNHPKKAWYQVILDNLDLSEGSSFSEYETYGNWMKKIHPDEIEMEYYFNKSLSKNGTVKFNLNSDRYDKFRSVSFHAYNTKAAKILTLFK